MVLNPLQQAILDGRTQDVRRIANESPAELKGRAGRDVIEIHAHAAADLPGLATVLVGEHDFSAFRSAECQAKSPVRTVHSLLVERSGEKIHPQYRAEFENAFSVSWAAIPFSQGANSRYASADARLDEGTANLQGNVDARTRQT